MQLTIFSVPKPFTGPFGRIQENAIRSWLALPSHPRVVLFGREEGVESVCSRFGLEHEPDVELNEFGTPLLDDVFRKAQSRPGILCFANADIVFMSDLDRAIRAVEDRPAFLLVGRRSNLRIEDALTIETGWEERLRADVRAAGDRSDVYWIDYFAFRSGLFDLIPRFAVGRPGYDNWLIWKAKDRGADVIDASDAVEAVHQLHDYSHFGERDGTTPTPGADRHPLAEGIEARRNREMLERWDRLQTIAHSSHRMTASHEIRRTLGPPYAAAKMGLWWRRAVEASRPLRRRFGIGGTGSP